MRPITKQAEPDALADWRKRQTPDALTQWSSPGGDDGASLKSALRKSLLDEQGFVCCYCEQRIEKSNSHIEHLASRDSFPKRSFDYSNLLACCLKPKQCGDLKGNKALKVHPLVPNCREYFRFTGDGKIRPVDDPARHAAAEEAIGVLGLGLNALNAQRRTAVITFAQILNGLEPQQARTMLTRVDERDAQGRNTPFASAIVGALNRTAAPPRK